MKELLPDHLTIAQKNIASCYLLAVLDALYRDPEGKEFLSSLFTHNPADNSVVVRLKHTSLSHKLASSERLAKRYGYIHDMEQNQDVFYVNMERILEISDDQMATRTNSLAVSILERLISYYYEHALHHKNILTRNLSLYAHNLDAAVYRRHLNRTSIDFLCKIFGLTHESADVMRVYAYKRSYPTLPVYCHMYTNPANKGNTNHAYHVARVEENPEARAGDELTIILINPWNNGKEERYSLVQLEEREAQFYIMHIQSENQLLRELALDLSSEERLYLFSKHIDIFGKQSSLLSLCNEIHDDTGLLDSQTIQLLVRLHQESAVITTIFQQVRPEEGSDFSDDILQITCNSSDTPDDKLTKLCELFANRSKKNFAQYTNALEAVEEVAKLVLEYPIRFKKTQNPIGILREKEALIYKLHFRLKQNESYKTARSILKTEVDHHHKVQAALDSTIRKIQDLAKKYYRNIAKKSKLTRVNDSKARAKAKHHTLENTSKMPVHPAQKISHSKSNTQRPIAAFPKLLSTKNIAITTSHLGIFKNEQVKTHYRADLRPLPIKRKSHSLDPDDKAHSAKKAPLNGLSA